MRKLLILAALLLTQSMVHGETIVRATIDIGGRKFHDLMAFDFLPSENFVGYYLLKGTLTVPGVFTVPLSGFVVGCEGEGCKPTVTVDITAVENGRQFKVRYKMNMEQDFRSGTGVATLEDGSVLGPIDAIRIFEGRQ